MTQTAATAPPADAFGAVLAAMNAHPPAGSAASAPASVGTPPDAFGAVLAAMNAHQQGAVTPPTSAPPSPPQPDTLDKLEGMAQAAAHFATGTAGQIASGWRGVVGLLNPNETTAQTVQAMQGVQNWFGNTPQNAVAQNLEQFPGRISGAVESGLNSATQNIPALRGAGTAITHPGETLGNAAGKLASEMGASADVSGGAAALASVLPAAAGMLLGARDVANGADAGAIPGSAAQEPAPMGGSGGIESESGPASGMVGGGAAVTQGNPYPEFAGQETVRGPFPMLKAANTGGLAVSPAEQSARTQIASQVLSDPSRIRPGVATGDANVLRNEYEQARAVNPTMAGQLLKQKIADEQQSLSDYAEQQVQGTQANPRFGGDYERGDFLNQVMFGPDGIKGLIDSQKKGIYDQAFQQAGAMPVQTGSTDALLNDPLMRSKAKSAGQIHFLDGMNDLVDLAKNVGFPGAPAGSIGALEVFRQSANSLWSQQNKYFAGELAKAIDNDIAQAGGPGLMEQARQTHAAQQTMFGSPGIKTLFGDVDPNGVQTATPTEKILPKLNSMPFDQWRHVYDTYDQVANGTIPGTQIQVPTALQAAAQQAKAEMSGSLVRDVHEAGAQNLGVWNANAANKMLNSRAQKLQYALPPDQFQAMHTLNMAGQIMPSQFSYEGAAQQARRLGAMGMLAHAAAPIGASIGGVLPIPGAEWLGAKVGEGVGSKIMMRSQTQQARKLDALMESYGKQGSRQ